MVKMEENVMDKKEFIKKLKEMLQERLGEDYSVTEHSQLKNNKKPLSGLVIQKTGTDLGMVIYLDKFFEEYQKGSAFDEIAAALYKKIVEAEIPEEISGDYLKELVRSYEAAKPMIFCKLVNEKANRELLKGIPYFPFLDLAVIFYIQVAETSSEQMAITIDNKIMEIWGIDSRQLYQDTMYHMKTNVPQQLQSLNNIIEGFLGEEEKIIFQEAMRKEKCETSAELYCLQNSSKFGATSLLYGDTMEKLAEQVQSDLLILPSSIFEVLLYPDNGSRYYEDLQDMVQTINQAEVSGEDQLSNSIYKYDRMTKKISIVYQGEDL